jgi:hypothetical protein
MFDAARLVPADLLAIERQASQSFELGLPIAIDGETAEALASDGNAWSVRGGGRLIACMGIAESFPGRNGVCWAVLADDLGRYHLPLTRFARSCIVDSRLPRIEALALAADAEAILHDYPGLDPVMLTAAVMALPTPQCAWARLCGLTPVHVLLKYGAGLQTYMLFEHFPAFSPASRCAPFPFVNERGDADRLTAALACERERPE